MSQDILGQWLKSAGCGHLRPVRRILIANNGMAAMRFVLELRRWETIHLDPSGSGNSEYFEFVGLATPDDAEHRAGYLDLVNFVEPVPSGPSSENFACIPLIIEVARRYRVDAIWPGWGHASENPELARAIGNMPQPRPLWIGPPEHAMQALGDKIIGTIFAQQCGVPCASWSGEGLSLSSEAAKSGLTPEAEEALEVCSKIGYPVMLKASGGGGGKGIRFVKRAEDAIQAYYEILEEFPICKESNDESLEGGIFAMQAVADCKHIEVQVLSDGMGNTISLAGRDCSAQRRNQKVVEEGPPQLPSEILHRLYMSSAILCSKVGYCGAGTVEFLVHVETGACCFLEVNTRLQVEHPVTEALFQVSIPAAQVLIAIGVPLQAAIPVDFSSAIYFSESDNWLTSDTGIDLTRRVCYLPAPKDRHCIALRIVAEKPCDNFLPSQGTIERLTARWPANVWGYFSIGPGGGIHSLSESQFGHIFITANSRLAAIQLARSTLAQLRIIGTLETNIVFLQNLFLQEEMIKNQITTTWIEKSLIPKLIPGVKKTKVELSDHILHCAVLAGLFEAKRLLQLQASERVERFQRGHAATEKLPRVSFALYFFTTPGLAVEFEFEAVASGPHEVTLYSGKETIRIQVEITPEGICLRSDGGQTWIVQVANDEAEQSVRVTYNAAVSRFSRSKPTTFLLAPCDCKLAQYLIPDGGLVVEGEAYAQVISMKMSMTLTSARTGTIRHIAPLGATISRGSPMSNVESGSPELQAKAVAFEGKLPTDIGSERTSWVDISNYSQKLSSILDKISESTNETQEFAIIEELCDWKSPSCSSPYNDDICTTVMKSSEVKYPTQLLRSVTPILLYDSKEIAKHEELLNTVQSTEAIFQSARFPTVPSVLTRARNALIGYMDPCYEEITETFRLAPWYYSTHITLNAHLKKIGNLCSSHSSEKKSYYKVHGISVYDSSCPSYWNQSLSHLAENLSAVSCEAVEPVMRLQLAAQLIGVAVDVAKIREKLNLEGEVEEASVLSVVGTCQRKMLTYILLLSLQSLSETPLEQPWNELTIKAIGELQERAEELLGVQLYGVHRHFRAEPPKLPVPAVCKGNIEDDSICKEMRILCLLRSTAHYLKQFILNLVPREVVLCSDLSTKTLFPSRWQILTEAQIAGGLLSKFTDLGVLHPRSETDYLSEFSEKAENTELVQRLINKSSAKCLGLILSLTVSMIQNKPCLQFWAATPIPDGAICPNEDQCLPLYEKIYGRFHKACVQTFGDLGTGLFLVQAHSVSLRLAGVQQVVVSHPDYKSLLVQLHKLNFVQVWVDNQLYLWRNRWSCVSRFTFPRQLSDKLLSDHYNNRQSPESTIHPEEFLYLLQRAIQIQWAHKGLVPKNTLKTEWLVEASIKQNTVQRPPTVDSVESIDSLLDFLSTQKSQGNVCDKQYITIDHDLAGILPSYEYVPAEISGSTTEMLDIYSPPKAKRAIQCARVTYESPWAQLPLQVILIMNDMRQTIGSFSLLEDYVFCAALQNARKSNLPVVFIAHNSGARIGVASHILPHIHISWNDTSDPSSGLNYVWITKESYEIIKSDVLGEWIFNEQGEDIYRVDHITSLEPSTGVENLAGSAIIAREMSLTNKTVPTFTFVSGRTVGIGAYLSRLSQRVVQKRDAPIILTGYQALNKLLNDDVYASNDQLGGPNIMHQNGISHEMCRTDLEGLFKITRWLDMSEPLRQGCGLVGASSIIIPAKKFIRNNSNKMFENSIKILPSRMNEVTSYDLESFSSIDQNSLASLEIISDISSDGIYHDTISPLQNLCTKSTLTKADIDTVSQSPVSEENITSIENSSYQDDLSKIPNFTLSDSSTNIPKPHSNMLPEVDNGADIRARLDGILLDANSWVESQAQWGRSVVVGRGRMHGLPVGIIAAQNLPTQATSPPDPGDAASTSLEQIHAGGVWYPDSAYKTAQAIMDMNREKLPLLILANWRGFSGGTRDMHREILKFGSYIVDALTEYTMPIIVYIGPGSELRGGAWVVVDSRINPACMETYADPKARGGVIEPAGIVEIKIREKLLRTLVHSWDKSCINEDGTVNESKFKSTVPYYTDAAVHIAALHDTPERMLRTGTIKAVIPWEYLREFVTKRFVTLLKTTFSNIIYEN